MQPDNNDNSGFFFYFLVINLYRDEKFFVICRYTHYLNYNWVCVLWSDSLAEKKK